MDIDAAKQGREQVEYELGVGKDLGLGNIESEVPVVYPNYRHGFDVR